MLESYCVCEKGNVKAVNQDSVGAFSLDDKGLFVVADGMGGHYGGGRASSLVLEELAGWWDVCLRTNGPPGFQRSIQQLSQVLTCCHRRIGALAPEGQICGTTVAALWICGGDYAVFSVGDSRCYVICKKGPFVGMPVQLTHDDVAGANGPGGPANAGKLLRALGPGTECMITLQTGHVPPRAVFALCTDGIHKYCPTKDLTAVLRRAVRGEALSAAGKKIVSSTEENSVQDNYSLILVRC